MGVVDKVLNNWFGEPPGHSDNGIGSVTLHLYEPLREIERQRDQLLAALKLSVQQNECINREHRAIIKAVEDWIDQ